MRAPDRMLSYDEIYGSKDSTNAPSTKVDGCQKRHPIAPRTRFTAAELMGMTFPEPRWAVDGIIPEGLSLLVGSPKVGKSWLSLNIAAAVGSGGRALGKIQVVHGDALYLALEDPQRRLQQRLGLVLEGGPAPTRLTFDTSWPLLHDGGIDALDLWLTENPGARIVVVDVLARVRGGASSHEPRYDQDYRAMIGLKALADKHSIAVVVVHHTRKAVAEDYLDAVSGTQGLAGAADSVLVLARTRGGADATLSITGRDVEETAYAMSLVSGRWTLLDGAADEYELGEQRRRVLHLLRDEGPMRPKAIAQALDIDHEHAKKTCQRMLGDDQLDTDGTGIYFVPGYAPLSPLSLLSLDGDTGDSRDTHDGEVPA